MAKSNFIVRGGADFSAMYKGMNQAQKQIKSFGSSVNKSFAKIGSLIGLAFSFKALNDFRKETTELYKVQMQNEVKLATVMRQRMGASDEQIQSIKDLASAEQALGIIGDEVQLSGAQQLATFLKQTDSLKKLIPAMNNLVAQQYGYEASAESAKNVANMMGKAMTGQIGALTRVGITFSETEEQILRYGNESERAAMLAQVIRNNVGDMNSALAQTDYGRQKQLANTFGDIKEQFGAAFTQISILLIPALNTLATILAKIASLARAVAQAIATVFGKTVKQQEGVAVSASAGAAAENNLAKATKGAGKAAKGALAKFDELNTLQQNTGSSGDGSGADSGGLDISDGESFGFEEQERKLSDFELKVQTAFANIKDGINKHKDAIVAALAGIATAFAAFQIISFLDKMGGVTAIIGKVAGSLSGLGTAFLKFCTNPAVLIAAAIGAIVAVLVYLYRTNDDVKAAFNAAWDAIKTVITAVGGIIKQVWDSIIWPVFQEIYAALADLWSNHLSGLLANIAVFAAELIKYGAQILSEFVLPFISWFVDQIAPTITEVAKGIITVISGITEFLLGVFTGDWNKAWGGIQKVFTGVWNNIVAVLESAVNIIIKGINLLIKGLNKLKVKAPDWVPGIGGKSWGVNISPIADIKIPRLASGAYLEPNSPMLAVVGDNAQYGEFVTPEDKLLDAVIKGVSIALNGSKGQEYTGDLVLKIGETEFGRLALRSLNNLARSGGTLPLKV